jgi:hypothetical protein
VAVIVRMVMLVRICIVLCIRGARYAMQVAVSIRLRSVVSVALISQRREVVGIAVRVRGILRL